METVKIVKNIGEGLPKHTSSSLDEVVMGYKKIMVDNDKCSRRFHISYDPDGPKVDHVSLSCPYCDVEIFAADRHPAVQLARQENLVKTAELSDLIVRECHFKDAFQK